MGSPTTPVLCQSWAAWADLTPEQQALAAQPVWERNLRWASEILYARTQHRWTGVCPATTVVLRAVRGSWPYDDTWGTCGCWSAGQWLGLTFVPSPFAGTLTHHAPIAVQLPHAHPTVTVVTINGEPFTAWQVTPGGWLERTDGRPWSLCLPTGETRVTYTHGQPPPEGGLVAAVALARELVRAETGQQCRLPSTVVSVSRQGISQQLVSRATAALAGGTGLPEVDTWIRSVNPAGRRTRGSCWSPDLPGAGPVLQSGAAP